MALFVRHTSGSNSCGNFAALFRAGSVSTRSRSGAKVHKTMPTIETSGTLMDIRVQKDATRLDITWEDGRVDYLSWSNDNLLLKVLPGSVSFEVNGIGAFGGIAKVYLNKETR